MRDVKPPYQTYQEHHHQVCPLSTIHIIVIPRQWTLDQYKYSKPSPQTQIQIYMNTNTNTNTNTNKNTKENSVSQLFPTIQINEASLQFLDNRAKPTSSSSAVSQMLPHHIERQTN